MTTRTCNDKQLVTVKLTLFALFDRTKSKNVRYGEKRQKMHYIFFRGPKYPTTPRARSPPMYTVLMTALIIFLAKCF